MVDTCLNMYKIDGLWSYIVSYNFRFDDSKAKKLTATSRLTTNARLNPLLGHHSDMWPSRNTSLSKICQIIFKSLMNTNVSTYTNKGNTWCWGVMLVLALKIHWNLNRCVFFRINYTTGYVTILINLFLQFSNNKTNLYILLFNCL